VGDNRLELRHCVSEDTLSGLRLNPRLQVCIRTTTERKPYFKGDKERRPYFKGEKERTPSLHPLQVAFTKEGGSTSRGAHHMRENLGYKGWEPAFICYNIPLVL
jgi:hypothetical protein